MIQLCHPAHCGCLALSLCSHRTTERHEFGEARQIRHNHATQQFPCASWHCHERVRPWLMALLGHPVWSCPIRFPHVIQKIDVDLLSVRLCSLPKGGEDG